MRFAQPELLWFLLGLPLLWFGAWAAARRRRRALERFADGQAFAGRFRIQVSDHRRAIKMLLVQVALIAALLAAARPQWGSRLEQVTRSGIDVVVVLDTSLSMAAEDMSPSRLAQAKRSIDSLARRIVGNRVALVTFAGQASLLCPLTLDHAAVRLFLDLVGVEGSQVPGTALADALTLALSTFGAGDDRVPEDRGRAIVLFSDGEDHEGGLEPVVDDLRRAGVVLHAVGCGSATGSPIPLRTVSGMSSGYKKDSEDRVVTTRINESLLQELALATRGSYSRATAGEAEIGELTKVLSALDPGELSTVLRVRYEERFQFPLALALIALLVDTILGDRRRNSARGESDAETIR